jgi:hypothetical protein
VAERPEVSVKEVGDLVLALITAEVAEAALLIFW